LTDRQKTILDLIKKDDTTTTTSLAQMANLPRRTLMRDIAQLQDWGILSREGGRKEGHWVINKQEND